MKKKQRKLKHREMDMPKEGKRSSYLNKFILLKIVIVISIAAFIFVAYSTKKQTSTNEGTAVATSSFQSAGHEIQCAFHRKLDGICVQSESEINPPVVGVMVENALDAQPLSGVSHAAVVYEAPAEGNIPRFLALFSLAEKVDQVGPIRSSRPYYLDWLSEYGDAMYMHVGGSPEALQKIEEYKIFDMNEFFQGKTFWRDNHRVAPHNAYTSSELWTTAHEKNIEQFGDDEYTGWQYEEREKCVNECIKNISLAFSPAYNLKWVYENETGKYERMQNGRVHKDATGEAYEVDNIIVQHVKIVVIDEVGRKKITTLGQGKAEIFMRGYKIEGTWKKESRTETTQWFDGSGNLVKLAPGKTWVEVVEKEKNVVIE